MAQRVVVVGDGDLFEGHVGERAAELELLDLAQGRLRREKGIQTAADFVRAALHGDAAHQAWGVMDVLAVTDFPDWRMKSFVRSKDEGILMVLPREGGHLVRLYVELDALGEHERAADRGMNADDIIAKAQRIFRPFALDVKEVVWWSIYEIGHRLTDKFDDVPPDQV